MIATLIFDLGNVLVFYDEKKMIRQLAAVSQLDQNKVREILYNSGFGERHEKGLLSAQDYYTHFCTVAGRKLPFDQLIEATSAIFAPNEELISCLPVFKKKKIRLLLLSNTCDIHFEYILKKYPFFHHFDHLTLSYKVGARKPEKEIYQHALNGAECSAQECLFIDDLMENIQGAQTIGIPSHHFVDTKGFLSHLAEKGITIK